MDKQFKELSCYHVNFPCRTIPTHEDYFTASAVIYIANKKAVGHDRDFTILACYKSLYKPASQCLRK
jgi:hypothetical protein